MPSGAVPSDAVQVMPDVCALPLVQRLAAMVDRDPDAFRDGDALLRGWHVALFNAPTPQSSLRHEGLAGLGVTLPELGLPRIMAAGRRTLYRGDIPIGAAVRRESRTRAVTPKQGRSGRFAIVTIEHRVFAGGDAPVLIEEQDYVMREEETAPSTPLAASSAPPALATPAEAAFERIVVPDVMLLLRYCAITFNTHRIHYDLSHATQQERYPALVVNGGIPLMLLLELYRSHAGPAPASVSVRNFAPLFCGRPMRLCAAPADPEWRLWAEDDTGFKAVEVAIR